MNIGLILLSVLGAATSSAQATVNVDFTVEIKGVLDMLKGDLDGINLDKNERQSIDNELKQVNKAVDDIEKLKDQPEKVKTHSALQRLKKFLSNAGSSTSAGAPP